MKFNELPKDKINERVTYDPDTGLFYDKNGEEIGYTGVYGYTRISIDGVEYKAHRLAYIIMTGREPTETIDHIDRNKSNNKWSNLREATIAENNRNVGLRSNNKTGVNGVYKKGNRHRAKITVDGRSKHLGSFSTLVEAKKVRLMAELEYYGNFAPSLA